MNYSNYIGLDAHSSTCTFCVMDAKGVIKDIRKLPTNGRLIVGYLEQFKGASKLALEECDISSWLFEILRNVVDELIVCNPVENISYKRAKTDKLDAQFLADLLRGGFLKAVYHDGSKEEKLRVLMSAYEDNRADLVRSKNRYKAIFRRNGIKIKKFNYHDKTYLDKINESYSRFVAERLFRSIDHHAKLRDEYKQQIKIELKNIKASKYLMSITGIGEIHAAQIIAQIINPNRFESKHKIYSYAGLVRHPRISDGKKYGTKRIWGNSILKNAFKSAANSAIHSSGALAKLYKEKLKNGCNEKAARNAVARKIAALARSVWINERMYKDELIENNLIM